MTYKTHGLSVGIERVDSMVYLALKAQGKLNHQDYELITPMLDSAIAQVKEPKVKALIDATELEGWEIKAAWDDLKLGLKHGNEFEKIAIYGNKKWQEFAGKIGSWFIAGDTQYFENADEAIAWLKK